MIWAGLDNDAVATLLSDLIRCESPDPPGDETRVATTLATAMGAMGFAVDLTEIAPKRFNVMARVKGQGRVPALVFSAHMDTLPVGNGTWRHDPFSGEIEMGRIHGRGACDMKSGLAAMVSAGVAVLHGEPLAGDLVLAFTGGESSKCLGAQHLADTRALEGCGAILVSEPTSLGVVLAEKAAFWLRAEATGHAGHLSGGAARGNGGQSAILSLLAFLDRLPDAMPDEAHPLLGQATVNIGRIGGGTAINLIPDRAWAEIDLRLLPGQDANALEARLAALHPAITLERIDLKAAVETPADHPFAALCLTETAAILGRAVTPQGVAYFSDAAVLSPAFGLPMVIIGPGELGGSGGVDESVALADVVTASRIFHRIAVRWLS